MTEKYFTSSEFDNLASRLFTAKLAQANLVTKTDFDDKLKYLNQKITSNKTKNLAVGNELKKLQTFDSIQRQKSFWRRWYTKLFSILAIAQYFKRVAGVGSGNYIYFWKSKGLSDENITIPTTSDYILNLQLNYFGTNTRVDFKGSCLKKDTITYDHVKLVKIYIVYEISKNYNISSYPALEICSFGAVSLTKITNVDNYKYFGYGMGHTFFHTLVVKLVEMQ